MQLRVKEIERDESLGILKKNVSIDGFFSFESPSKATEIVKRIDDGVLDSLEEGASSRIAREIRSNFKRDSLNLVIFNLILDRVPDKNKVSTLAQHLYA